jgi:hypothetical protein
MLRMKLRAKFMVLVPGCLVIFFGILSCVVVQRQANLRAERPGTANEPGRQIP